MVRQAMDQYPETIADPYVLREMQGLSYEHIAEMLDISLGQFEAASRGLVPRYGRTRAFTGPGRNQPTKLNPAITSQWALACHVCGSAPIAFSFQRKAPCFSVGKTLNSNALSRAVT